MRHFLEKHKKILVITSRLPKSERSVVLEFLTELKAPVYAEATSGLREAEALRDFLVDDPGSVGCDAVLRLGGIPTHRFWRDLNKNTLPVCSIDHRPFSGLARKSLFLNSFFSDVAMSAIGFKRNPLPPLFHEDKQKLSHPYFRLSQQIPKHSNIYLGNSLPIREWDRFATRENRGFEVAASRGANGIDGQISTFLGWAEAGKENWGLFGDLTTLYDLAAPWILGQLPPEMVIRIVIINNGGGKIFAKLYDKPILENRHQFDFEHFAKLWKMEYVRWERNRDFPSLQTKRAVIERVEQ